MFDRGGRISIVGRVNWDTKKIAFGNSLVDVFLALLPLKNFLSLFVFSDGRPVLKQKVRWTCNLLILSFSSRAHPHIVAAVFFKDIRR